MPHCVIECPENISDLINLDSLVKEVHDATEDSGLFSVGDVKSRIVLSKNYLVGGKKNYYVHIVAHILSGRTQIQRKNLSDRIALRLCKLLPTVEMLSVEVREIDKEIYSNRKSVEKI